ncbi:hypothetical protein AMAG_19188 [Allomyces macrogynus ATCC 38327]|uniref:Uncharacterized protein n=1 Tax=Allomyces macrogynus (strain ATCC 38327) TaxID=578462 RepID=A0A0L0STG1_ALLM3|nr:hypothetical protein AMAG_19188 [Allomyces macrogynus ATCC 38327]|eukprot:KNE65609.1 hypothetical protein AMAG_19188 [Allomyces macrogynus ATCC 38327]
MAEPVPHAAPVPEMQAAAAQAGPAPKSQAAAARAVPDPAGVQMQDSSTVEMAEPVPHAAPVPEMQAAAAQAGPAPKSQAAAARAVPDPAGVQMQDSSTGMEKEVDGPGSAQQPPEPLADEDAARLPVLSIESPAAADKLDPAAHDSEPRPARGADAPSPRVVVAWDPETTPEPHKLRPVDVNRNMVAPYAAPLLTEETAPPIAVPTVDSAVGPSAQAPPRPATPAANAVPPPPTPLVDDAHAAPPAPTESDPVSAAIDAVAAADPRNRIELYSAPTAPAGSADAQEVDMDVPMDENEAALEPQVVHVLGESLGTAETLSAAVDERDDEAPDANGRDVHGPLGDAVVEVEDAMDRAAAPVANGVGAIHGLPEGITPEVEVAADGNEDVMDVATSTPTAVTATGRRRRRSGV